MLPLSIIAVQQCGRQWRKAEPCRRLYGTWHGGAPLLCMIDFFCAGNPVFEPKPLRRSVVASIEPRSCNGCGQWCGQCLRLVGRLPA